MPEDPNIEAYRLLRHFVPEFRDWVKGHLVECYGPDAWLDGIPPDVWGRLTKFQEGCEGSGEVPGTTDSLLDFSYEEDLVRIVTEERNWRKTFRRFFPRDPNEIKVKFRDIRRTRDRVAHFRVISQDELRRLTDLCVDITKWIAQAGVRHAELQSKFDLGAVPNERHVQPTGVHQFFDNWVGAPGDEVLMFQSFAPRQPVARSSRVYLAIRYNPVAQNVPGAKGKRGVGWWRRRTKCAVRDPDTEEWKILGDVKLEPEGWTSVEYVPRSKGRHDVTWGARPSRRAWVRDKFDVR